MTSALFHLDLKEVKQTFIHKDLFLASVDQRCGKKNLGVS